MIIIYHGIAERIILVAELEYGLFKGSTLRETKTLCERACGDIAHDDLKGNDLYGLDRSLTLIELFNEMGGNALCFEHLHELIGNDIVYRTLSCYGSLFFAVECGRIVLIGNDINILYIGRIYLFCLALIELSGLFHDFLRFFLYSFFICCEKISIAAKSMRLCL